MSSATPQQPAPSSVTTAPPSASQLAAPQQGGVTELDPKAAVAAWNDAHRSREASAFDALYADSVLFYGRQQSKAACVAAKRGYLAKHSDFRQELVGEPQVQRTGTTLRATFVKQVTLSGKSTRYPSYLVFELFGNQWRITNEGDDVTDATLKKRVAAAMRAKGVVVGDWDGDGTREPVRLVPPKLRDTGPEDFGDCEGPCNCTLTFDKQPSVMIENCIGGVPVNEGDLNGDGGDELGLLPDWWTSCWHGYYVLGLRKGQWTDVVSPISTHCAQWEDGVDAISKDPNKPGYATIRSMVLPDFDVKTFSVPVK